MERSLALGDESRFARSSRSCSTPERLRELHAPVGDCATASSRLRQFAVAAPGRGWLIVRFADRWYVWLPAAVLLGFVVFSFTVLLHEVVHRAVFARRGHWANAVCSAGCTRCPAGSRRASSRAGTSTTTASSGPTTRTRSATT